MGLGARIRQSLNDWQSIIESVRICETVEEKDSLIENLISKKGPIVLSFANAHAFNLAWRDSEIARLYHESDVILRDGIGVKILYALLGTSAGLNLNGTDVIPEILARIDRDRKLAIYGTNEQYLGIASNKLEEIGYGIVSTLNGFLEQDEYINDIGKNTPGIILLAMGMPKQEILSIAVKQQYPNLDALIINGGAIVDHISGKVTRAPEWMCKSGLEWLYRLSNEPRRLWRRNLGSIIFLFRAVFYLLCTRLGLLR